MPSSPSSFAASGVDPTGIVLVTALPCSPLVHQGRLCLSVLAFALLASRAMEAASSRERWLNGVPLLLAATLIGLTVPALCGDHFVREILGRNAMTIDLECLFLGCLHLTLAGASHARTEPLASTP